jgi:transposase
MCKVGEPGFRVNPNTPMKQSQSQSQSLLLAAVDVSAAELVVAIEGALRPSLHTYANTAAGHQLLIGRLLAQGQRIRVVMEATGLYGLNLAWLLQAQSRVEVMVINPRSLKDFVRATMTRAKTDRVDALGMLDYLRRMAFVPWTPPAADVLILQQLTRRLTQLKGEKTREQNRLHAVAQIPSHTKVIARDLRLNIAHLQRRILALEKEALRMAQASALLAKPLELLTSVPGIAHKSALRLLGELLVLPNTLKAPQWVAHAGLDPRPFESGSSVHKARRLSKTGNVHLRSALFLPALVAIRHCPAAKACYNALLARGKKPKQAVIAIMRKLLHAIWGILHHQLPFNPSLFHQPSSPLPIK